MHIDIDKAASMKMYAHYSAAVQLYHAYDLDFSIYEMEEEERREKARASLLAQTVILFMMSDEEYAELLDSMKGHIVQAKIRVSKDRKILKTIYDQELLNRLIRQ